MQLIAAPRQLHQLVAQIMVIVRRAVDSLRDALAVGIVAIGDIRPGLAHPRELAAVLPCVGPRAIAQKVADLVRRQALAADAREQIAPACIAVAIGNGAHRRAQTSGRIGVLRLAQDVPAAVVGIRPRLPRRLIVLANKLVEAVVGIEIALKLPFCTNDTGYFFFKPPFILQHIKLTCFLCEIALH